VLQNVGITSIEPIEFEGREVVPIQFLKALLPDPSTLGENYTGKTSIGCLIEGWRDGQPRKVFIYNICDHEESWNEVRAQAVSYTTGVPAMVGAKMMLTKQWRGRGVFNVEQLDPDPFLAELAVRGLPWHIKEM
jgi:saccharopine dehydrogenase (NAD+, L-lysine-forming)